MSLNELLEILSINLWHIFLTLGILFFIYQILLKLWRCYLDAGDFHAFAIHDGSGILEIVKQPRFHFSLLRPVVKGSSRAREFEISYFDTQLQKIVPYQLLNPSTGAISLRDVSLCLDELKEYSRDNQPMLFRSELRFRLDADNLEKCFLSTRFGDSLERYFVFTIRQLISSMNDEEILGNGEKLRNLAEKEMRDFGSQRGFKVNRVLLNVVRGPLEVVRKRSNSTGDENPMIPIIDPTSLQYLDRLRDTFANVGKDEDVDRTQLLVQANEYILELMRLRNSQAIAHELAQSSSGLIVISTEELGMAKTAVSRSRIAAVPPSKKSD